MLREGEHVHRLGLFRPVAAGAEDAQVPGQGVRVGVNGDGSF